MKAPRTPHKPGSGACAARRKAFAEMNATRNRQTSVEKGAHVLLLSEQNWSPANDDRWSVSSDSSCAVVLTAIADFVSESTGSGRGFAWTQIRGTRIYSCYTSRNDTDVNFAAFLDDIQTSVRECDSQTNILIGGDFNAWSQEWGSARNDLRGGQLADLAASLDLAIENSGSIATYRRINAESVIDVTFSRLVAPAAIFGWKVLDDAESGSDHRYITYTLDPSPDSDESVHDHSRGWSYRQLNPAALATHLMNTAEPDVDEDTTASQAAERLTKYLEAACDSCMPPRVSHRPGRTQVHWWSKDLASLRETTNMLRRSYQRSARRHDNPDVTRAHREAYTKIRKELRNAIRAAQDKSWSELCKAVDADPWGLPYRVVTKKIGRKRPGIEARGRESSIADHLFPHPPATDWSQEPQTLNDNENHELQTFSPAELAVACKRLPAGKATGPDGIPNEVLKLVSLWKPRVLLDAYNVCLKRRSFPDRWKTARLVLLHKGPTKPLDDPSSFRPLCMLDSAGKLLERLVLGRLNDHLDRTGNPSENQYGFRNGRSTLDAIERVLQAARGAALGAVQHRDICVAVSLDVRNAFNSAPWRNIDAALRSSLAPSYLNALIRSYLEGRNVLVGESLQRRSVTCGVPQGSVLGPCLWNVFYDGLLNTEMPPGVQLVAFADDVAVIGTARTGELAGTLMNPALQTIATWMRENGLQLAPQKSEFVVLTKKKIYNDPVLTVEGHRIPSKRHIRYLGVELDTRLSFTKHVSTASKKATDSARAIGRLMPNVGGLSQKKRQLLGSVVNSKLLYASPVWATVGVKTAINRAAMARAQRTISLRTIRAYRTVSADATAVLSAMMPADLIAHERARAHQRIEQGCAGGTATIKKEERAISTTSWQKRWDRSTTGRWTHRLLPNVRRWMEKPPMDLTFHMTQVLSGHGCFRKYLFKMNRADDGYCVYCMDPEDTADHTVFSCPRWLDERARMSEILRRPPNWSDVEEILCGPRPDDLPDDSLARLRLVEQARVNRNEFNNMVESIMTEKEADEREEQSNA
ncbi:hypothetical protein QTP88_027948 [Uroleucon formosanum]